MHVRSFTDPAEFHARVRGFLESREAERTIEIGIVGRFATDPAGVAALGWGPLLAICVEDGGEVVSAAVKTKGRNLVLTGGPSVAVAMIADHLVRRRVPLPGVVGPEAAADDFARAWRKLSTDRIELAHTCRLFECTEAVMPADVPGEFAEAASDDLDTLAAWTAAFNVECAEPQQTDPRRVAELKVAERSSFVWKDPRAVSFANIAARAPRSARIGPVYTPAEHRNRGYATALVAALTRRLLDEGLPRALLFTDLDNPTSNSIYPKVGYRFVADFHDYAFTPRIHSPVP